MKKMLIVVMLMPLMVLADTEIVKGIEWTFTISGGTAALGWGAISKETVGAIEIPSTLGGCSVTSIGGRAFEYCSGLTSVAIPSSVTCIANDAFSGCQELTDIFVDVENEAYCSVGGILYDKQKTKLLVCPQGKVGEVVVPDGVVEIALGQFSDCKGLESVSLPASIAKITTDWSGNSYSTVAPSFWGSSKLTSISVDEDNMVYKSIDGVLYDRELTQLLVCPQGKVGVVSVPEGVAKICRTAFVNCHQLESVVLPSSVDWIQTTYYSMGNSYSSFEAKPSFFGCENLVSIIVTLGNGVYNSKNGILYNQNRTLLLKCPEGKTGIVEIPNDVTMVFPSAFERCEELTAVSIPSSVIHVGNGAFNGCVKMMTIYVAVGDEQRVREMLRVSGMNLEGVSFIEGSPIEPDTITSGDWSSKHTFNGLAYNGELLAGLVQVSTAKISNKGEVKISGFVMLQDGKKQSIKATGTVEAGILKASAEDKKLGHVELTVGGNGFSGSIGGMKVESASVGENTGILKATVKLSYFDAKTGKLKTKSLNLGGVTSDGEAIGTLSVKKEAPKVFESLIK